MPRRGLVLSRLAIGLLALSSLAPGLWAQAPPGAAPPARSPDDRAREPIRDAIDQAEAYRSQRDFASAREQLARALRQARHLGDASLETQALLEEAALHGVAGNGDAALASVQAAIERLPAANDPRLEGTAYRRLAEVWNFLGDTERADQAVDKAAAIYETLGDAEGLTQLQARQSAFANHRGRYQKALALGLQSLGQATGKTAVRALGNVAYAQQRLGDLEASQASYERLIELAWEASDQASLDFAYCNLAEVRWLRGEAKPALEDLERAIASVERARSTLTPARDARARFLETEVRAFDRLVRFRAETRSPVAAFEAAERFHGRSLTETLDPARQLAPRPPTADSVRAGLDPEEVLIAYWVAEDGMIIWALDRQRLEQVHVPIDRSTLERELATFLAPLRSADALDATVEESAQRAHLDGGLRLSRWLIEPLPAWVHQAKRWILVPDGILHYLAFAALPTSCSETLAGAERGSGRSRFDSYRSCRFLGLEKALSRTPSAGVLLALRERDQGRRFAEKPLLAMAPSVSTGASQPEPFRDWRPLEHHRAEARSVAESVVGSVLLLEQAATETHFKSAASDHRWLHVASHGRMDDEAPEASGILFGRSDSDDGLLGIDEVLALELDAELVTLSACRSGHGALRRGEGIQGLGQAFLAAGASSLVLSLWDVDDRTTPQLMESFYERLAAGDSAAEALRHARAELAVAFDQRRLVFREHRTSLAHPRFWGGFVVLGDG